MAMPTEHTSVKPTIPASSGFFSSARAPSSSPSISTYTPHTFKLARPKIRRKPSDQVIMPFLTLLYFSLLSLSYVRLIVPIFSYEGYFVAFNFTSLIVSLTFVFIIAMVLASCRSAAPVNFLLWLVFLVAYVPFSVLFSLQDKDPILFLHVSVAFMIAIAIAHLRPIYIPAVRVDKVMFHMGLWAITLIAIIMLIASGGIQIFSLNLYTVYERRPIAESLYSASVLHYLIPWTGHVFLPAIAGLAAARRKWVEMSLAVLMAIGLFGLTTHKAYLLATPSVVLMAILGKKLENAVPNMPRYLALSLMAGLAVSWLSFSVFGDIMTTSILIRRMLFVPAYLAYAYYELFSEIGFVYGSSTLLGFFMEYPHGEPPVTLVSRYVFGDPFTHANTGIFGTGYMHFGVSGIYFWIVVAGVVLYIARCVSVGLPTWLVLSMLAVPVLNVFTNADLPTGLMTHGLGVALVLIAGCRGALGEKGSQLGGTKTARLDRGRI